MSLLLSRWRRAARPPGGVPSIARMAAAACCESEIAGGLVVVRPAQHRDAAGADHLKDAELLEHLDGGIDFALVAEHLDDQRLGVNINDIRAEDLDDIEDLSAVEVGRRDFDQGELAVDHRRRR